MKQKHPVYDPWPAVDAMLDAKYKYMTEKEKKLQWMILEGFKPAEIARALGWTEDRVKRIGSWINRGW